MKTPPIDGAVKAPGSPLLTWATLLLPMALAQALLFASETAPFHPPAGPHAPLSEVDFAGSSTFAREDRLVGAHYFYWYDIFSQAHILNPDGSDALTTHPASMTGFSYKSKEWHKAQLRDMMAAGIDLVLPVYWGAPSERNPGGVDTHWSYAGLERLVQAREELVQDGLHPPLIGMFYDTSTLEFNSWNLRIDLTTPHGRQWFYESVRDFFSMVPPRHWGMINGQPVVFLYSSAFALRHDQSVIDYCRASFARDFAGRTPYIVREISWNAQTEDVYAWGGALGLKNPGVASLGPGYDHTAVPGRPPLVVDREEGEFFERNWIRFLRNPSPLVVIETWNEFHEGTDIAESREYGRAYIELNRQFVELFKAGIRPPMPIGPFTDARMVSVLLRERNVESGLFQIEHEDGRTEPALRGGAACRKVVPNAFGGHYIYFRIDDSFKWGENLLAEVEVEYFDGAGGSFVLQFDGSDLNAPFQGAYSSHLLRVPLAGSQTWKTARFKLAGARFLNRQNGGADFRLAPTTTDFFVRAARVIRPGLPKETGENLNGLIEHFIGPLETPWKTGSEAEGLFTIHPGRMVAGGTAGVSPAHLWLDLAPFSAGGSEVLARFRVVQPPEIGEAAGVMLAFDPDAGTGFNFSLGKSSDETRYARLRHAGLGLDCALSFAWELNTWYWARIEQAPRNSSGFDVRARIWQADGVTEEPLAWLCHLESSEHPPESGLAGIVSGSFPSEVEFDFFLLKAEGLAAAQVQLPPPPPGKPARWSIRSAVPDLLELILEGERESIHQIESSSDLRQWTGLKPVQPGEEPVIIPWKIEGRQRFFRARLWE
jgi:hypothetical protein